MSEFKDRRLKYVEMPKIFQAKSNDIDITAKQHLRTCEKLAESLAKKKAKTAEEFENLEKWKNFVIKSSELSEKMIGLIEYINGLLNEVAEDAKGLSENAKEFDRLRDQSETIEILTQQRNKLISEMYAAKKANY